MYDDLTMQKLYNDGVSGNTVLRAQIDSVLSRPRYLDGPPDKYTPVCKGIDVEPFGAYTHFRRMYEHLKTLREQNKDACVLYLDERPIRCDFESYVIMRTLMECGITKSESKAQACRDVFITILKSRDVTGISKEQIARVLKPSGDYYVNEIIHAVIDCLFTDKEQVILSLKESLGNSYGDDALELLGDPEDLEELDRSVRANYKKACASQDFRVKKHLGRVVNVVNYLREVAKSND